MSWHDFFTLPHYTYSHNLAYAYGLVFAVQGGYLAWILRGWLKTSRKYE